MKIKSKVFNVFNSTEMELNFKLNQTDPRNSTEPIKLCKVITIATTTILLIHF
jgi:hypothetical protein